jgi:hypothetical protein
MLKDGFSIHRYKISALTLTREELLAEESVNETTKLYALKALETLGS